MTKDQKKNVRKLIRALRSGKYEQARGALRDGQKFCCLGVACDLYDPAQWEPLDTCGRNYWFMNRSSGLPIDVQLHFGIPSCGPALGYKQHSGANMIDLNDEHNQSFKQIALRLERWLAKQ